MQVHTAHRNNHPLGVGPVGHDDLIDRDLVDRSGLPVDSHSRPGSMSRFEHTAGRHTAAEAVPSREIYPLRSFLVVRMCGNLPV